MPIKFLSNIQTEVDAFVHTWRNKSYIMFVSPQEHGIQPKRTTLPSRRKYWPQFLVSINSSSTFSKKKLLLRIDCKSAEEVFINDVKNLANKQIFTRRQAILSVFYYFYQNKTFHHSWFVRMKIQNASKISMWFLLKFQVPSMRDMFKQIYSCVLWNTQFSGWVNNF